jgi:hypothetical protein
VDLGLKQKLLALGTKKLLIGGAALVFLMGAIGVGAETGVFTDGTASPSPSTASSTASPPPSELPEANAGGKNVVNVVNRVDGKLRIDGKVQFNRIQAPNAGPENVAIAYSQCKNCQTIALALQINLISTSSSNVQPKNFSTAVNYQCDGCVTIAWAIQYNLSVDNPHSFKANQLVARMRQELAAAKQSNSLSEAEGRFNAVISEFQDLYASLKQARQEETAPTTPGATPMPSSSDQPAGSPSASATGTPEPSPTPTASP